MASSGALRVELVSPERVLFSGEAKQVITRTLDGGEIAFLPGHIAFLGALTECHTRIYEKTKQEHMSEMKKRD